jgi:hypothetical protein
LCVGTPEMGQATGDEPRRLPVLERIAGHGQRCTRCEL